MWKVLFPFLAALFAVGCGAMPGGFSTISSNDEGAQNAIKYAVVEHNKGSNDAYLTQVTSVVKVERQVVAGYKYKITVNMARTTCRKTSANEQCPLHTDAALAKHYQCTFTVWTQPWNNFISLVDQKC
ncbi:hypothetical protein Q5P01_021292 [Channa striata]|uniref:Cystatin domain-containing protein n=1 Tax=Channa striata TaxID=64152 RepID=A0AA88LTY2_CHASR|nr:hypothetical protein Q5P01_021292 [Channa striata]